MTKKIKNTTKKNKETNPTNLEGNSIANVKEQLISKLLEDTKQRWLKDSTLAVKCCDCDNG